MSNTNGKLTGDRTLESHVTDLPENVRRVLDDFINSATEACGGNVMSIVLFGSAAEGRLRPTSDVNLVMVLKKFEVDQMNKLREILRVAYAAIRFNVMFILDSEIAIVSEAFAVKFTDIVNRNRVLWGSDLFKNLEVSREATLRRLSQVIANLTLRLRERYVLVSLREEQLVPVIADVTGPIRSIAATILGLDGNGEMHPKEALQEFSQRLPGASWSDILKNMSIAREVQELKPGAAVSTMLGLIDLLSAMQRHVQGLR